MPVACAVAVALAGVIVARQTGAELYRLEGREQLAAGRPQAALEQANAALSLNGESLEAYYLKAAAVERLNAYVEARRTLEQAIAREPENFLTWTLIGDLYRRGGELARARRAYARALTWNPLDPDLLKAVNDPALREPQPPAPPAPDHPR